MANMKFAELRAMFFLCVAECIIVTTIFGVEAPLVSKRRDRSRSSAAIAFRAAETEIDGWMHVFVSDSLCGFK